MDVSAAPPIRGANVPSLLWQSHLAETYKKAAAVYSHKATLQMSHMPTRQVKNIIKEEEQSPLHS